MSLRLGRKPGQSLMIGDDVKVTVLSVQGNKVTLDISAPINIPVHRQEVYDDIQKNGSKRLTDDSEGV
jgi:carbon storage regulator